MVSVLKATRINHENTTKLWSLYTMIQKKKVNLERIKDIIITVILLMPYTLIWGFCIMFGCLYIGVEELKNL